MAPENIQVVHLKLQMQPDNNFFKKFVKDNQAQDLQNSQDLPITPRRVHQLLHELPNLVYRNRETASALTAKHKMRVDWVTKKVIWTMEKWETMFSDEKKFNLDGPNSFQCYWHDLRKEKQLFSKRLLRGESVVVWGAFSVSWKGDLVVMEGKQNSA